MVCWQIDYLYHRFTTNTMINFGYCTETIHFYERSTSIVLIKLSQDFSTCYPVSRLQDSLLVM